MAMTPQPAAGSARPQGGRAPATAQSGAAQAAVCRTKIVATLGPAAADYDTIRDLALAGADVFRFNFSHGTQHDHAARHALVRRVEAELGRPVGILADMQGPKLRVGCFAGGKVMLVPGASFRFDLSDAPGDATRVCRPPGHGGNAANTAAACRVGPAAGNAAGANSPGAHSPQPRRPGGACPKYALPQAPF